MDDIITYWGAYTSLAGVVASPFYARVEIPVNPRNFEQWRTDVFSPPSLYLAMLPEVLSKATFTLHAVLPIPVRYLAQMSNLQLEYLARSLYDDQYEERKNALKGDAASDDNVGRLERTYSTLGRINIVFRTRIEEHVGDGWSLQNISDAVENMLMVFEEDLGRTKQGEARGRGRTVISPFLTPPPTFVRTCGRTQSPDLSPHSGHLDPLPGPRLRGKGFRSFLQRDWASPSANDAISTRAQAPSSSQSSPSVPVITMTISPGELSVLHEVAESGQLTEKALLIIKSIVRDNPSHAENLEPGTRLVESGQLTEAAVQATQNIDKGNSSHSVSPKKRTDSLHWVPISRSGWHFNPLC